MPRRPQRYNPAAIWPANQLLDKRPEQSGVPLGFAIGVQGLNLSRSITRLRFPWTIAIVVTLLLALGIAGIARSEEFAQRTPRFARLQLIWCGVGVLAFLGGLLPGYRKIRRWGYVTLLGCLALLVAVFFFSPVNGAHRWIRVGPIGLQPSELAKLGYVIALARYLSFTDQHQRLRGFLVPLFMTVIPVLLVMREPDLGTALLFPPLMLILLFTAGARVKDLVLVVFCGVLLLPLVWSQMNKEQRSRITSWFDQAGPGERPFDDGYQLYRAKQVLTLGGPRGTFFTGRLPDDHPVYHLPEAHTDFVFSVIGESWGWLGMASVVALFVVLAWRGLSLALDTQDPFARLLATGIAVLFVLESFVNIAMTLGLLPVTGIALPLISYGGSNVVVHCGAAGLLGNLALRSGHELGDLSTSIAFAVRPGQNFRSPPLPRRETTVRHRTRIGQP